MISWPAPTVTSSASPTPSASCTGSVWPRNGTRKASGFASAPCCAPENRHRTRGQILNQPAWTSAELERAVHDALASDALPLEYQPIIAVATEAVDGYEALLRWTDRQRGP